MAAPARNGSPRPELWMRLLLPGGALGPGKLRLMRAVAETGSVSAAAKAMAMSRVRALKLVGELNALGPVPLVVARAGGEQGGGAGLTPLGCRVLVLHERVEAAAREAAGPHLRALQDALTGG